jgi:hypothetical protein
VHLRLGAPQRDGGELLPVVQRQDALSESAPAAEPASAENSGGEWIGELLASAASRVLDERFTPSTGQHCTHCAFRSSCSARPEGRQIIE